MNTNVQHDPEFEKRALEVIMLRTHTGADEKFNFESHQYVILNQISDADFREKLLQRYRELFATAIRMLFENHPKKNSTLPEEDLTARVEIIVGVVRQILEGKHVYNRYLESEDLIFTADEEHIPKAFVMFSFDMTAPKDTEVNNVLETGDELYLYSEEEGKYKPYVATAA